MYVLGRFSVPLGIRMNVYSYGDNNFCLNDFFSDHWWPYRSSCLCCYSNPPQSTSWMRWMPLSIYHTPKTLDKCYVSIFGTHSSLWCRWKTECSITPMSSLKRNLWMVFRLSTGLCKIHLAETQQQTRKDKRKLTTLPFFSFLSRRSVVSSGKGIILHIFQC